MCDKELLVGYVYGELTQTERRAFDAHLTSCAECRDEADGLRATRAHLGMWSPPGPEFGFRIVRGAAAPASAPQFRFTRAWGLAAAAVLVLAAAAAIANVEMRYGDGGLVVRTGWRQADASSTAPTPAAADSTLQADLQVILQRLGKLESAVGREPAGAGVVTAADRSGVSESDLRRRLREIVKESEARQQRELALQMAQVISDVDAARRSDMLRMQQGLMQLQGVNDAEIVKNREMWNHVLRIAQPQRDER
ncbi:MAG: zf-HC2 domain-containing protein [Acidobacteria bacterium]|nr:zf-HC2 domain-containing protein [Acidobacteriota bacterium]MCA1648884.1 zf-HC2 domain-containing protein [Acidobacteriota bacterium]